MHYVASLNEVDKYLDDILRLQEQSYSYIAPGYRDFLTSDGYLMYSRMGKD